MIRMKPESYSPITIQISSIEMEVLLTCIKPAAFSVELLQSAAEDLQQRLMNAKDRALQRAGVRRSF